MTRKKLTIVLVLVLTLSLAMSACIHASGAATLTEEEIGSIINTTTDASQISSPFTSAVAAVKDSVVLVRNYQMVSSYPNDFGYGFGFGFGYGYGNRGDNNKTEKLYGTGSGTVVTAYGHILTNYHVVEGASRVTVWDGENEYEAEVVVYSEEKDIAVLLAPDCKLPAAPMGDSDSLQVGEWAIVIGNPLGADFFRSTTVGIVSSLERNVESRSTDKYGRKTTISNSMIQVDAAINSGNSGGGMFNVLGQLMGIPSMKYTTSWYSSADVDNIGMCIPINVAKPLVEEALRLYDPAKITTTDGSEKNTVAADTADKPRMGITVTTLSTSNSAVAQGMLPNGAYVKAVDAGSPAEAAGIQEGDIIVEVDGTVITSHTELVNLLSSYKAGDVLAVKVYRSENILTAEYISELAEGEYIDMTVELKIIADPAA